MTALLLPPVRTLLGFLDEQTECDELRAFALRNLNEVAHQAWFEIAEKLPSLEVSLERVGTKPECHALTALLLSQTHYHLEQYGQAMRYALQAKEEFLRLFDRFYKSPTPDKFNLHIKQFVDIIVGSVLGRFIADSANETVDEQNEQIQAFVWRVIDLPSESTTQWPQIPVHALKPLLGVTLDACRVDLTERVLRWSLGVKSYELMNYVVTNNTLLISTRHMRTEVFRLIAELYKEQLQSLSVYASPTRDNQHHECELSDELYQELPQYVEVLATLEDVDAVANILRALIGHSVEKNKETTNLMALQLAFDITGFGNQSFLNDLKGHPTLVAAESPEAKMEMGEHTGKVEEPGEVKKVDEPSAPVAEKLRALNRVLTGNYEYSIILKFAHLRNGTDKELLEHVKSGLDSKHYVLHTSLIVAHGLMLRGTTHDGFLRRHLEWFGRSLCWGKFSATASLGVIHQTHTEKSFRVLSTYLPGCTGSSGGTSSASTFSDGGSLYAMGLIHANRGDPHVITYLLSQLSIGSGVVGGQMEGQGAAGSSTVNEISQHGASLGLGLVAMGTHATPLYEALKSVLLMDSAVSGEAAAIGIGLIMMGSGSEEVIDELYQYSKDTRHEKIVRACSLAIAFVCYGREEYTTEIVQKLLDSSDPLIRYGGCFALGLSWCGSGREATLRHLLHLAVSDSSNDVRRAAILAISYVLCNLPGQTPRVLRLLTDSFNFHVRFAAALAIGISCAGTASKEALEALVPATRDSADVVRQAAYIGLGLVLMECPDKKIEEMAAAHEQSPQDEAKKSQREKEHTTEKARKTAKSAAESELPKFPTPTKVREHFVQVATDRREDIMARVGALIGLGLLDAGGRNVVTSFYSPRGVLRKEAVAGFALFSQYWYWYPLMLTVSLAMQPSALIGLTGGLRAPKGFMLECDAPASHFAYPKPFTPKKRETNSQSIFALLSAAQRRTGAETVNAQLERKEKEEQPDVTPVEPEIESSTHEITNMSRFLIDQAPYVKLPEESRYQPVFPQRIRQGGIIMLHDTRPDEPETYHEPAEAGAEKPPAATTAPIEQAEEAPVPEPFELD